MSALGKAGALARLCLRNPGHLREGMQAMYERFEDIDKNRQVKKRHAVKDGLPTVCILDILPAGGITVDPHSFLYGMSPPMDIALLKALAMSYKDCAYLEIGSWRGESLANVASVAKECVSISLSAEEMRSFGATDNEVATANFFSRGLVNVKHIEHNSHTFDFTPYHGKFDLVFIDGDHHYEGVLKDTVNAFKLLRNDDSMIVWHDYGKSPETVNWAVLAAILDGSPPEAGKHMFHVSNTLCAIYSKRKIASSFEEFACLPRRRFSAVIRGEPIPVSQTGGGEA